MTKINPHTIRKILIIRPDAVGDVVLMTPLLRALRERFPQATLTVLARAYTAPLLTHHPDVHDVWEDPLYQGKIKNPLQFFNYVKTLRRGKFDWVVHSYSDFRYAIACALAGIRTQIGDKRKFPAGLFFNHGEQLNLRDITQHEVEFNLALLKPLGVHTNKTPLHLVPDPSVVEKIKGSLRKQGLTEQDTLIGFHLGTGGNDRAWPPEKFAATAKILLQSPHRKIILTGGEKEQEAERKILSMMKHPALISSVNQYSLDELLALLSLLKTFVSVDTGPFHMAAGLAIPMVALLPAKFVKPFRWGPWMTRHLILRDTHTCPLQCIPHTCRETYCLDTITPEHVAAAVETLLAGRGLSTEAEAFQAWCQHSFSTLLVAQQENSFEAAQTIATLLQEHQHTVTLLAPPDTSLASWAREGSIPTLEMSLQPFRWQNIQRLIRLIGEKEITHIHPLDPVGKSTLYLASHLSSIQKTVQIPPLLISDPNPPARSLTELIAFYVHQFKHAKQFS